MTSAGSNIDETFLSEANQILDGSARALTHHEPARLLQIADSQLDHLQARLKALVQFRTQLILPGPMVCPIGPVSELHRLQASLETKKSKFSLGYINKQALKCQARLRDIYGVLQTIPNSEAQQARCKALYLELTSVFGSGQPL